jgi:hypothetical protein
MPFLYNILMGALGKQRRRGGLPDEEDELEDSFSTEANEDDMPVDLDVVAYTHKLSGEARVAFRYHRVSYFFVHQHLDPCCVLPYPF